MNGGPLIAVLANLMSVDGDLNAESAMRLRHAVGLANTDPHARLVTSGWGFAGRPDLTIAAAMARTARDRFGMDPRRIRLSPRARDTVGDAVFIAVDIIASDPSPERLTVVTSTYHGPRAAEIFGFVFSQIAPVTVDTVGPAPTGAQKDAEARSIAAFRATFDGITPGDLPAILDRLWAAHPLYNGEIYGPDSPGVMRPPPDSV